MAIDQTNSLQASSLAAAVNVRQQAKGVGGQQQATVTGASVSALGLANIQSQASRPAFNLVFNNLQNQIIDRLNKKITEVTDASSNGGGNRLLLEERKKLVQVATDIEPVRAAVVGNNNVLNNLSSLLGQLNSSASAADSGDPTEFNRLLGAVNEELTKIQNVDGGAVGLYVGDGSDKLKRDGLMQVANPDGTTKPATQFSDYSSTTDALSAITDAMYRLSNVQSSAGIRAETLVGVMSSTQNNIQKVDAQLQMQDTLDYANQLAEVSKLKQQYSLMLQALSMAFEGSQSMADTLGAQLLGGASVDRGSVMNLFT